VGKAICCVSTKLWGFENLITRRRRSKGALEIVSDNDENDDD